MSRFRYASLDMTETLESWKEVFSYLFPMHIKYSSKLLSRHALGLNLPSFIYFSFTGPIRSSISSPTKTLRMRFPHFLRNTSATSRIARLSSIDRYWSTQVIPVVNGAISEVITSNFPILSESRNIRIFSNSNTLSSRR